MTSGLDDLVDFFSVIPTGIVRSLEKGVDPDVIVVAVAGLSLAACAAFFLKPALEARGQTRAVA